MRSRYSRALRPVLMRIKISSFNNVCRRMLSVTVKHRARQPFPRFPHESALGMTLGTRRRNTSPTPRAARRRSRRRELPPAAPFWNEIAQSSCPVRSRRCRNPGILSIGRPQHSVQRCNKRAPMKSRGISHAWPGRRIPLGTSAQIRENHRPREKYSAGCTAITSCPG